jgi:4-amino-4-deoxy-L-arabinose transferase-like glycosyltransferase
LFGATAGLWTVIALNATPIFNIGAVVMTIDALSVFFWMAAMFTFWLAVESPDTLELVVLAAYRSADRAGFLCKYTNAFELISC